MILKQIYSQLCALSDVAHHSKEGGKEKKERSSIVLFCSVLPLRFSFRASFCIIGISKLGRLSWRLGFSDTVLWFGKQAFSMMIDLWVSSKTIVVSSTRVSPLTNFTFPNPHSRNILFNHKLVKLFPIDFPFSSLQAVRTTGELRSIRGEQLHWSLLRGRFVWVHIPFLHFLVRLVISHSRSHYVVNSRSFIGIFITLMLEG